MSSAKETEMSQCHDTYEAREGEAVELAVTEGAQCHDPAPVAAQPADAPTAQKKRRGVLQHAHRARRARELRCAQVHRG